MTEVQGLIKKFGRAITVKSPDAPLGREGWGIIWASGYAQNESFKKPAAAGLILKSRYKLIASPDTVFPRAGQVKILAGGKSYRLLRIEPIYFAGRLSQWEGVLRPEEAQV